MKIEKKYIDGSFPASQMSIGSVAILVENKAAGVSQLGEIVVRGKNELVFLVSRGWTGKETMDHHRVRSLSPGEQIIFTGE